MNDILINYFGPTLFLLPSTVNIYCQARSLFWKRKTASGETGMSSFLLGMQQNSQLSHHPQAHKQKSQEGKYLLRRHQYVIMVKSTRRCSCSCFGREKKNLFLLQVRCFPATASILLLFPPAASLRLEIHPSKSWEQSLLRHVKTIFLLDWQINFSLPGARPETKVHRGCRGSLFVCPLWWWKNRVLWYSRSTPLKDLLDWKECRHCYSSSGCGRGSQGRQHALLAAVKWPFKQCYPVSR